MRQRWFFSVHLSGQSVFRLDRKSSAIRLYVVAAKYKKTDTTDNLQLKDLKEKRINEQPTYKQHNLSRFIGIC